MRKSLYLLFLSFVFSLSACAKPPVKAAPGPETQRSHAHEAQDELSSEVHK
jgi:hypothetical protein